MSELSGQRVSGVGTSSSGAALDNVRLGVAFILATNLALSLGDATIKIISADFVLWQIFVLRGVIAVPTLILMVKLRSPATRLVPLHLGWTALRSLLLTFMWITYWVALPHLDLGIAAATYYTLPIFITLLAAIFVGDRIGAAKWIGIFLGFFGVILILKPDASGFNAYALLPLASAIFYSLAMILTRTKCRGEHALILAFSLNVTFVMVGLLATLLISALGGGADEPGPASFLLGDWSPMRAKEWLSMTFLAIVAIIGSVGAAVAYQAAPPATIAAFDFAYVGLAAIWGFVFFGEVPDIVAVAGMILIVAAGVLATRR